MELFYNNGHLTPGAFQQLQAGSLHELQRLEISEHLSFCDDCLCQYLQALDNTELMVPAIENVGEKVVKSGKAKKRAILLARYSSVAAVAVLAAGLWSAGMFNNLGSALMPAVTTAAPSISQQAEPQATFGSRFDNALAQVNTGLNSFFGGLFTVSGNNTEQEQAQAVQTDSPETSTVTEESE